jgi:hypothetical protein
VRGVGCGVGESEMCDETTVYSVCDACASESVAREQLTSVCVGVCVCVWAC